MEKLEQKAKALKKGAALLAKRKTKYEKGELKQLKNLTKSGDQSSKAAAFMMKIQKSLESGSLDVKVMDQLLTMAGKKNRKESEIAIDALKELFLLNLLPNFELEYLSPEAEKLKKAYLHDRIKHKYAEFLQILARKTSDTVENSKKNAIRILGELAITKVEARRTIIGLIVNKLGDPIQAVPTMTILTLNNLYKRRRDTLKIVVGELNKFLFRKNLSIKAKFYGIVMLNSLKLRSAEQDIVSEAMQIYIKLFPVVLAESMESNQKSIGLLLQGVNKVFPLSEEKPETLDSDMEALFKLTHFAGNYNIQIQSLRFIYQIQEAQGLVSDRYYRTLYEFCMNLNSYNVNQRTLFISLNTILLSLKKDHNITRVKAFIKRLMQVCLVSDTNFICAILLLLSELFLAAPALRTLLTETSSGVEEEEYHDVPESDEEEVAATPAPTPPSTVYSPHKRDPKHSCADSSCLFEINTLKQHFHPTVKKWTNQISVGEKVKYNSDPILDFSLINFLDRFQYKAPKKNIIAKLAGKRVRMAVVADEVNSASFMTEEGREDEDYYRSYFSMKKPKPKPQESESEEGEEDFDFDAKNQMGEDFEFDLEDESDYEMDS